MKTYTIKDFEKQFPTDDACLDFLFKARYPNGVYCQKCGKITKHYKRAGIKFYSCEFCGMGVAQLLAQSSTSRLLRSAPGFMLCS